MFGGAEMGISDSGERGEGRGSLFPRSYEIDHFAIQRGSSLLQFSDCDRSALFRALEIIVALAGNPEFLGDACLGGAERPANGAEPPATRNIDVAASSFHLRQGLVQTAEKGGLKIGHNACYSMLF